MNAEIRHPSHWANLHWPSTTKVTVSDDSLILRRESKFEDAIKPHRRQRTVTAILDAASEAFSLMGVRNATMGEIADRAGMARANLYYNFASKEEMAAALAERYRAKGYAEALHLKAHEASAAHFLDAFFTYAGEWTRS